MCFPREPIATDVAHLLPENAWITLVKKISMRVDVDDGAGNLGRSESISEETSPSTTV